MRECVQRYNVFTSGVCTRGVCVRECVQGAVCLQVVCVQGVCVMDCVEGV